MQAEHRSTSRVLNILTLVANSEDGYTLTQLSNMLDAPKSSLSPILATMRAHHFLSYSSHSQIYRVGPSAFHVGMSYINRTSILGIVQCEMDDIVAKTLETSHFAVIDAEGNVVYLLKKDSPQIVRMQSTIGRTLPAYGTGIGKALLIDKNLSQLKSLYPGGLAPLTPGTITDFDELYRQLCTFRKDDIAYEQEESNQDICCVGVALRKGMNIVAALSVAMPVFRQEEEKTKQIREILLDSKHRLEPIFREMNFDLGIP